MTSLITGIIVLTSIALIALYYKVVDYFMSPDEDEDNVYYS